MKRVDATLSLALPSLQRRRDSCCVSIICSKLTLCQKRYAHIVTAIASRRTFMMKSPRAPHVYDDFLTRQCFCSLFSVVRVHLKIRNQL